MSDKIKIEGNGNSQYSMIIIEKDSLKIGNTTFGSSGLIDIVYPKGTVIQLSEPGNDNNLPGGSSIWERIYLKSDSHYLGVGNTFDTACLPNVCGSFLWRWVKGGLINSGYRASNGSSGGFFTKCADYSNTYKKFGFSNEETGATGLCFDASKSNCSYKYTDVFARSNVIYLYRRK